MPSAALTCEDIELLFCYIFDEPNRFGYDDDYISDAIDMLYVKWMLSKCVN